MAIIGAHMLLYTAEPEQLRAVLRDVFGFSHVDAGHGWLIFALPPSEVGVHPADGAAPSPRHHQMSLMCDDIHATVGDLRAKGIVVVGQPHDEAWGTVVTLALPGGCDMMLYQPRHPLAIGH
jgi:hypothetical protein